MIATNNATPPLIGQASHAYSVGVYGPFSEAMGFRRTHLAFSDQTAATAWAARVAARFGLAISRANDIEADTDLDPTWVPWLAALDTGAPVKVDRTELQRRSPSTPCSSKLRAPHHPQPVAGNPAHRHDHAHDVEEARHGLAARHAVADQQNERNPRNRTPTLADHNQVNQAVNDSLLAKVLAIDQAQTTGLALVNARYDGQVVHDRLGNVDSGAVAFTDWITYGTLVVPAGATRAIVHTAVTGIFETGTGSLPWQMRVRIGGSNGFPAAGTAAGVNIRFNVAWGESFTGLTAGTQTIAVQATRSAGGYLRFDTQSRVTWDVSFLP